MFGARPVSAIAIGAALGIGAPPLAAAYASSSADELVRQARSHEAAHEEDVAARRYTEALTIDPLNADGWIGLGDLRLKLGEGAEAERVFTAALERIPSLSLARARRARVRWGLGRHADAEADLEAYADTQEDAAAYRELAAWFGVDGRVPAQLATWRRLLSMAAHAGDDAALKEADRMVRALVVLADRADPASSPADPDETRRGLARMAARAAR
jgi:tetratricopeptide (TPR) repeat protein